MMRKGGMEVGVYEERERRWKREMELRGEMGLKGSSERWAALKKMCRRCGCRLGLEEL
jgi:hypothetical protein